MLDFNTTTLSTEDPITDSKNSTLDDNSGSIDTNSIAIDVNNNNSLFY